MQKKKALHSQFICDSKIIYHWVTVRSVISGKLKYRDQKAFFKRFQMHPDIAPFLKSKPWSAKDCSLQLFPYTIGLCDIWLRRDCQPDVKDRHQEY